MERAITAGGKLCYSAHCYVKAYIHQGNEEGLSSGVGKIKGENALYELKKKYFNQLNLKERNYIRMRHHAVLAFAYSRKKDYLNTALHGVEAVVINPVESLKLIRERR